jgi:thiosulfate reductase/polysulfide reductase chain A
MAISMKRRTFIKIASGAAAGTAVAGGLGGQAIRAALNETSGTGETRDVATFCELCFWKCGMIAKVRDGKVIKLEGNPRHPLSNGKLCPRGNGATGSIYDPDRLKQPMIRVSKRGGDEFRPVSWDEALDYTAERMDDIRQKYGPECMALFNHGYGASHIKHLWSAFGSPNVAAPSYAQCRGPREVAFDLTYGEEIGSPERIDIKNTRMLVLLGSHLGENMHNTQVQEFSHAISNGAKLVVVDPRFSTAAGKADHYLPIKPGTDMALLLGWMHVIINEGLYDKEYVETYTVGFDQLRQHVQAYTPERVWTITGIKPDVIRKTAREMGHQKPGVLIHPGRHVTWYGDDTQRVRAVAMLTALLGAWGREGGYFYPGTVDVPKVKTKTYPTPARSRADLMLKQYPLASHTLASGLCDATFPVPNNESCQIRGWFVYGTNLLRSLPNPEQTRKALESLEFVAVSDILPTEITGWADVLLPDTTFLERYDDLHVGAWREPFVSLRQPAVKPMYDAKPPWWVAKELGKRLGLEEYFPWTDMEDYLRMRLAPTGISFEQLKAEGTVTFPKQPMYFEEGVAPYFWTESGKIELYSNKLARNGQDPMPTYTNHGDPPKGYYRLIFGRAPMHTFGRTTNNPVLNRIMDENEVWVNRHVAAQWGLKHGQTVKLQNQDGVLSQSIKVKVTERIRNDAVYMVHGFGHTAKGLSNHKGATDSELVTKYVTDPIMGGTGMNHNFVTFIV